MGLKILDSSQGFPNLEKVPLPLVTNSGNKSEVLYMHVQRNTEYRISQSPNRVSVFRALQCSLQKRKGLGRACLSKLTEREQKDYPRWGSLVIERS